MTPSPRLTRRAFLTGAAGLAATHAARGLGQPAVAQDTDQRNQPNREPVRPMRSPETPHLTDALSAGPPALPPLGVIALNRAGYGLKPGDLEAFNALGASDGERMATWVDRQLDPESIDDSLCEQKMAEAGFYTFGLTRTQQWDAYVANPAEGVSRSQPMREIERAAFVRALYSERQLLEVMAEFWFNHFNVYGYDYPVYAMITYYDSEIIRKHALGNFHQMVIDVAQSTSMLYYLDNYASSAAGPNENFARELLELHTLGAENYFGVMRQEDVPLDGKGVPLGYVDDDILEATRCLTGWTVANNRYDPAIGNTGAFYYRDDWHDRFQKYVLGRFIPSGQAPLVDGLQVIEDAARHTGTAHYVCKKLVRRFVSDDPPEPLVQSAAEIFVDNADAPDQIARVVRHLLLSPEFANTWGEKVKRPIEFAASVLRAGDADFTLMRDESDSNSFMWLFSPLGQMPYRRLSPDGYPDVQVDWLGTTGMIMRWRLANWLIDVKDENDNYRLDVLGDTPDAVVTPIDLVDYWVARILGRSIDPNERQELIDFMAQGRNPDYALPMGDSYTLERIRSLVGLIFMSPSFQWR